MAFQENPHSKFVNKRQKILYIFILILILVNNFYKYTTLGRFYDLYTQYYKLQFSNVLFGQNRAKYRNWGNDTTGFRHMICNLSLKAPLNAQLK